MLKFIVRAIIALLALVGIVYGAGMTMPREHLASSRIQLTAPRDSVFAVLRAFGNYPRWNPDFKSSVRGQSRRGRETWVQEVGGMTMSVEFKTVEAPSRMVTEVVSDEKSDWGGVWTYDLVANGSGTEVTITEDGWITSPLFRVMMKARGTHSTMDAVLKNLGVRFGEQVTPEHLK